jgi:penicillin amidase
VRHGRVIRGVGLGILVFVVLTLVATVVTGTSLVRRSWPQDSGTIALEGLGADVTVIRDARGVPHIYADNATDLFRAQGFVAAQDRFFEMDLRRHVTAGRLSELVGRAGIDTDKMVRTMGWRRVAEEELPNLTPATRRYLAAYADGVNDYLATSGDPSNFALEYSVLALQLPDYRVEKWTALDSLTWLKAMAWDMRSNFDAELTRARLAGLMDPTSLQTLYPAYPEDEHQPILSEEDWQLDRTGLSSTLPPALTSTDAATGTGGAGKSAPSPAAFSAALEGTARALRSVTTLLGTGEGLGSNSWVLGPSRTTTGQALLANDPHLGVSIPGIWYQTGLHCRTVSAACPFDVSGFSFAGMPGIVIGHNARVAWGMTNLAPDVADLYYESLTGDTYLRGTALVPLAISREVIKVAGGEDFELTVRRTVHGPIISDVIPSAADAGNRPVVDGAAQEGEAYAVSLAWTGLVPNTTAEAIFQLNSASNFAEFRAAARNFSVPSQNLLYADVDGHIGYQAPGLIPFRETATDGTAPGYLPAPGWDPQYDWRGFLSFDELPWAYDPAEGYIVAANQKVTLERLPFLTSDWDAGWRSQRINDLLAQESRVSPERMAEIQADTRNGFAPDLVEALLKIDLSSDPFTAEAQELLRDWDFTQPADESKASAAAAYYNAVWAVLVQATFDDQLPADLRADGGGRWWLVMSGLLDDPGNAWWNDRRTPSLVENRDEILRRALVQARLDLTRKLGSSISDWSWGKLHSLTLTHPVLGGESVPSAVRRVFNRGPLELPGGSAIVNANGWDASKGFQVNWAPSMRMVVDLGNLDASTWVTTTGTSGHAYHPNYADQVGAWSSGGSFPWPFTAAAVQGAREAELTLTPKR